MRASYHSIHHFLPKFYLLQSGESVICIVIQRAACLSHKQKLLFASILGRAHESVTLCARLQSSCRTLFCATRRQRCRFGSKHFSRSFRRLGRGRRCRCEPSHGMNLHAGPACAFGNTCSDTLSISAKRKAATLSCMQIPVLLPLALQSRRKRHT